MLVSVKVMLVSTRWRMSDDIGSVILVCELGSGLGLNRSSIGPQSRGVSVCKSLVRPPVGKVGLFVCLFG